MLKDIRENQQLAIEGAGGGTTLKELGILSTEEVEDQKEQVRQEAAEQEQETVQQSERQLLYES